MVRVGMVGALVCSTTSAAAVFGQRSMPPVKAGVMVDDHYILALAAADTFLHAWAARDVTEARAVLTPAATARYSPDELATLIQGTSSPHHESFEIGPGARLSPTKYAFDVIEYLYMTNMGANDPRPKPARLVVVQTGPETWLVDEFPDS